MQCRKEPGLEALSKEITKQSSTGDTDFLTVQVESLSNFSRPPKLATSSKCTVLSLDLSKVFFDFSSPQVKFTFVSIIADTFSSKLCSIP